MTIMAAMNRQHQNVRTKQDVLKEGQGPLFSSEPTLSYGVYGAGEVGFSGFKTP